MKNVAFWSIAILITVSTAYYQRFTGPTYSVSGKIQVGQSEIKYSLDRSHETPQDYEVAIQAESADITGYLIYRRYKSPDPWTKVPMNRKNNLLRASLPHQPPAGKLAYKIVLISGNRETSLTGEHPVIIRFKGHVPTALIIPHIIIMFAGMLISTRGGIEALRPEKNPQQYAVWTTALLFIGGLILGPLVQKFAFGQFWTGFPLGSDLTDTKILIALMGWIIALTAGRRGRSPRFWILGASILLLIVYLIPHSLMGSELDYSKMDIPPSNQTISQPK